MWGMLLASPFFKEGSMKTVGIIGAMDIELEHLKKSLENLKIETHRNVNFYIGEEDGIKVVLMKCGIGKVASSRGCQMMSDIYNPDVIINTGIAGGVGENLSLSDIVVSTSLVQHDFDVTGFGYPLGYCCIGGDKTKPSHFVSDKVESDRIFECAVKVNGKEHVKRGVIATGDQFICTKEKKMEIYKNFGALATEMEGCAIAEVCFFNEIPFVILRAISDLADGSAPKNYTEFERKAADTSAKVILEYLKSIN